MPLDLRQYDDDFVPAPPAAAMSKVEGLADGEYLLEIAEAKCKTPKGNNILELHLEVLSPGPHEGMSIQHSLFINNAEAANRVGRDLLTLGFDTDQWKVANGRPFSVEFEKAVKLLKGLRFKGTKKTNESGGKTYHNLYIDERVRTDGQPERFGPEQLNAAADPDDPFGLPE
jgi:hypothetical protein